MAVPYATLFCQVQRMRTKLSNYMSPNLLRPSPSLCWHQQPTHFHSMRVTWRATLLKAYHNAQTTSHPRIHYNSPTWPTSHRIISALRWTYGTNPIPLYSATPRQVICIREPALSHRATTRLAWNSISRHHA